MLDANKNRCANTDSSGSYVQTKAGAVIAVRTAVTSEAHQCECLVSTDPRPLLHERRLVHKRAAYRTEQCPVHLVSADRHFSDLS